MSIKEITLLIFIVVLGAFFRFFLLNEIPIGLYPDEAMNGNNAIEAIATGDFKVFYQDNNGREGLFINLQALSIWFFGNEAWVLRIVSALFGTLTIFGIYLLAKELFWEKYEARALSPTSRSGQNQKSETNPNHPNPNVQNRRFRISIFEFRISRGEAIALLSSFFLATSYWHLNFSRIGFRAITIPFFATLSLYFLLKGLRRGKIFDLVWAGIFTGLGFYSYLAFRFMPFVLAVPLLFYIWQWMKHNTPIRMYTNKNCIPCGILLFLFIAFVVTTPLGYYFLQHPEDILGRSGQVSIFSAPLPIWEFIKSNALTTGMLFVKGDCNWRHNFNCQPELHPLVAFLFIIGLISSIRRLLNYQFSIEIKNSKIENFASRRPLVLLLVWLIFMSFPATLTREGLPHALRSIGMIPPVMIIAAIGAWKFLNLIFSWFEKQKISWPEGVKKLNRIQKELKIIFILILLFIPLSTYYIYFVRWSHNKNTFFAFSTDTLHLGRYLRHLPQDVKKIVVINERIDDRVVTISAQTVLFITDTFLPERRAKKRFAYVRPEDIDRVIIPGDKFVIAFLDSFNNEVRGSVKKSHPELRAWAPSDFVILQNY